jgi:hypothetical protein
MCLALVVLGFVSVSAISSDPQANIVTFSASDDRLEGPEQLPAGQTTVRLRNQGKQPHQLKFIKLEEGKSPADLAAALKPGSGVVPSWAKHMGGPNGADAGKASEATLYLEPGTYVVICGVPGKHHLKNGPKKAVTVIDTASPPAEFRSNFHMAMFEYEFVVVQPLQRGRHSFYVINRGSQVHQATLVRLDPGASVGDMLAALVQDIPSPLPGKLVGGMSGLEPGRDGTFTAELTPGHYAIMCLFGNGESHAAKGMVTNFIIH